MGISKKKLFVIKGNVSKEKILTALGPSVVAEEVTSATKKKNVFGEVGHWSWGAGMCCERSRLPNKRGSR